MIVVIKCSLFFINGHLYVLTPDTVYLKLIHPQFWRPSVSVHYDLKDIHGLVENRLNKILVSAFVDVCFLVFVTREVYLGDSYA